MTTTPSTLVTDAPSRASQRTILCRSRIVSPMTLTAAGPAAPPHLSAPEKWTRAASSSTPPRTVWSLMLVVNLHNRSRDRLLESCLVMVATRATDRYRPISLTREVSQAACYRPIWRDKALTNPTLVAELPLRGRRGAPVENVTLLIISNSSTRCPLSAEAVYRRWRSGRLFLGHNRLKEHHQLVLAMRLRPLSPRHLLSRCLSSRYLVRSRPPRCTPQRRRHACEGSRRKQSARLRQSELARRRRSSLKDLAAKRQVLRPSPRPRVNQHNQLLRRVRLASQRPRQVWAMLRVHL